MVLWNSLPIGLRQMDIGYEQFKWQLNLYVWVLRLQCIQLFVYTVLVLVIDRLVS